MNTCDGQNCFSRKLDLRPTVVCLLITRVNTILFSKHGSIGESATSGTAYDRQLIAEYQRQRDDDSVSGTADEADWTMGTHRDTYHGSYNESTYHICPLQATHRK